MTFPVIKNWRSLWFGLCTIDIYCIDQIEMIEGALSSREQRLVEAWIVLHQNELLENWERLQLSELPLEIALLK